VLLVVALLHCLVLWRMAVVMGYISERHTLLLVMCGLYWAVPATLRIVDWLAALAARLAPAWIGENRRPVVVVMLMLLFLGFGLPPALKPLHYNRAGHRAAGAWLAANARPGDIIVDPFCWAHYYSGWVFREGKEDDVPPGYRPNTFAVFEKSPNPHHRLPLWPIVLKLKDKGHLVFAVPLKSRRGNDEQMQIYQIDPPPLPVRKRARPPAASAPPAN
jgi:hypothetical protein